MYPTGTIDFKGRSDCRPGSRKGFFASVALLALAAVLLLAASAFDLSLFDLNSMRRRLAALSKTAAQNLSVSAQLHRKKEAEWQNDFYRT